MWCPPEAGLGSPGTTVVTLSRARPPVASPTTIGAYESTLSIYEPALGVGYSEAGSAPGTPPGSDAVQIFATLGHSPRSNVLAPGSGPRLPPSWKRVTFAGFAFAVPPGWPIDRPSGEQRCTVGFGSTPAVTLESHESPGGPCGGPDLHPVAPVDGIEVDAWNGSYGGGRHCRNRPQAGLQLCLDRSSPGSILFVKATESDGRTVGIQIGLAGDGRVARLVLDSLSA
jgi:hypothetical protein